jgi:hypothetical protein
LVSKSTLTDSFLRTKPTLQNSSTIFAYNVENTNDIKIRVKLVLRKSDGKILYAQADNDFADLILSFLTFPLGGVVRMFGGNCSLGSVDALYQSIVDLDENKYFVTKEAKKRIVDPYLAPQFKLSNQILPIRQPHSEFYCHDESFITCENRVYYDDLTYKYVVSLRGIVEGYVKGPRTYVVTDNLFLTQSSPTAALRLINYFQSSLDDLEEKFINIGVHEVCNSICLFTLISITGFCFGK